MTNLRTIAALALALLAFTLPAVATAQSSPSAYTTGHRYDLMGRETGTISPDPDSTGALKYAAVRKTYDDAGRLTKVETGELASWQSESVAPASWSGFTVLLTVETTYDGLDRKLLEIVKGSDNIAVSATQYSYDAVGRLECTAVRMNTAVFGSLPSSACTLGTQGSNGPDRITKNIYDDAGQLLQVRRAYGVTGLEQAYVTYSYTDNGKQEYVVDANGNKAKLEYDGYDRQVKWIFPSTTLPSAYDGATPALALSTAGSLNTSDYEQYGYDANGNRTSLRKRDGSDIAYTYDALNRMTVKDIDANSERSDLGSTYKRDVYYTYDARGLETAGRFDSATGSEGVTTAYDGFGRITTATTAMDYSRGLSFTYDKDGNRTQITHPDNTAFTMTYDGLNRLDQVKKSTTVLVDADYNSRGGVSFFDRYSTSALEQTFTYDAAGRLSQLAVTKNSSSNNVTWTFTRNAASQLLSEARDNDLYAWGDHANRDLDYTPNGLNQYATIATGSGSNTYCYDANGNLTDDGQYVYHYDVENRLAEMRARALGAGVCPTYSAGYTGTVLAALRYDPKGRLYEAKKYNSGGTLLTTSRFVHDGDAMVLEYNSGSSNSSAIVGRYLHGNDVGADDPLVWYDGSNTSDNSLRHLYADIHGSIVFVGRDNGNSTAKNAYDEWGVPDSRNLGRFQYTGQVWLPEIGMYYYKARIYAPQLGRFLQVDPIGYEDQVNLYAYVGNDPVNGSDPTGRSWWTKAIKFVVSGGNVAATIADVKANIDTLRSSTATTGEKVGAAISIASEAAPVSVSDVKAVARAARGAFGGLTRKQAYGNPSTSAPAVQARAAGEGTACPGCGRTMTNGTETAPQAQHNPNLSDHYNEYGGADMTAAERRAYARSSESIDGAKCETCQRREGLDQQEKYRDKQN